MQIGEPTIDHDPCTDAGPDIDEVSSVLFVQTVMKVMASASSLDCPDIEEVIFLQTALSKPAPEPRDAELKKTAVAVRLEPSSSADLLIHVRSQLTAFKIALRSVSRSGVVLFLTRSRETRAAVSATVIVFVFACLIYSCWDVATAGDASYSRKRRALVENGAFVPTLREYSGDTARAYSSSTPLIENHFADPSTPMSQSASSKSESRAPSNWPTPGGSEQKVVIRPGIWPYRTRHQAELASPNSTTGSSLPSHHKREAQNEPEVTEALSTTASVTPHLTPLCPAMVLNINSHFRLPLDGLDRQSAVASILTGFSKSEFLMAHIDKAPSSHSGIITLSMNINKSMGPLGSVRSTGNGSKIIKGRRDTVYGELKVTGHHNFQLLCGKEEVAKLRLMKPETTVGPGELCLTSTKNGLELARAVKSSDVPSVQKTDYLDVSVTTGMDPVLALLCVLGAMMLS